MTFRKDFTVVILSHGRADNVLTYQTLIDGGYTGDWFLLVDDDDEQLPIYIQNFGEEHVYAMNKEEAYPHNDTMDNFHQMRIVLYARNEAFRIVKEMGYKYFLVLDDDYTDIGLRWVGDNKFHFQSIKDYDRIFNDMIRFMETTPTTTIAFAQGGDFIGGKDNQNYYKGLMRKAMNSFFCDVDRPFQFTGSINEDVNAYVTYGSKGYLFFTYTVGCVVQLITQSNAGGLTDIYLDRGTYVKSFYSVMTMPSAVKVTMMGAHNRRIHHRVEWDKCTPMILNESWRKERDN